MPSRRTATLALVAFLVGGLLGQARAETTADLEASSEVLERLNEVLPGFGIDNLHLVGGAALSLALSSRNAGVPSWNDIDVRAIHTGSLTAERMEEIGRAIGAGGFAKVLVPGPMEFLVHHATDPTALHAQGFGLRMQTAKGLRFDVALLSGPEQLTWSGYNSAESIMVPLKGEHDLHKLRSRLQQGSIEQVVGRGDVVEPHGHAAAVMNGKMVLVNEHNLGVEPELHALRFLRGMDKLGRYGKLKVDGGKDLRALKKSLATFIAHAPEITDPSYAFRVQEQANALLAGDKRWVKTAKRLGLDLNALAAGKLVRTARR